MDSPHRSLQLTEARARFDLLDVTAYDVVLDLAGDEKTFTSLTTIDFTSRGGETFVDLKASHVNRITFNGRHVDPDLVVRGRLPLVTDTGENRLVVDAVMPFRNDGEGLHRSVDPADGRHYVYGMSFMDAAPTIFACFDQPDLKAPYTFHVTAPKDWTVIGNAPGTRVETGPESSTWELEQTQPLSTYFVTLVAGPYHVIHDEHAGIPLSLSSRRSIAKALDEDADELFTMTKQCFDEFHRLFGIRYPFGNYHQAFVPEFNAGAMENPGCVTFRDPLLFTSRVTRGERIQRATTVAHEMAHQWFGNITTPKWWDDLWLNESFAEYMGNRVAADVTQYDDAWIHAGYARRQWGLVADQRPSTHPVAGNGAVDATAALQDFDGISYAKGSTILRQLNTRLGDEVFFGGVIDHFERNRFGNATMHDLFASWERAGAGDLSAFTDTWLRTTGADTLTLDRDAGVVRRTPPAGQTAARDHAIRLAVGTTGGWQLRDLVLDREETPVEVPAGAPVVLDPDLVTWALPMPDDLSLSGFQETIGATDDPAIRLGIWNAVRSGFHNARIDPEDVIRLAEQSLPSETNDDALRMTLPFLNGQVTAVSSDPVATSGRVHAACRALLERAAAGSTTQLAAFQGAVASSHDVADLRGWLAGTALPAGLEVDADLRWRLLIRVATLGGTDRPALDKELQHDPSTKARVDHAAAVSSLPDHEAKAWAWSHFDGTEAAANYELLACGTGLWRAGQEEFTAPYVERYFAELPDAGSVHSGWVLGNVTEFFFPISSLEESTVERAKALIERDGLDLTIRRNLVDMTDSLERLLAIRRAFPPR
ncbi:aminopeptidase N [Nocardioides sp. JQ2195]|uniref:aminopeptidase N n=1 Tax=Nocardioides sp. JQ2195 TaxID=2592334 RepID=UPI00143EDEFE|nr:aminopeptidase N [Nocardioides sp. JQ2195]QIX26642.1 aminopeptidase N [Nocardioides sp. JQ2195]